VEVCGLMCIEVVKSGFIHVRQLMATPFLLVEPIRYGHVLRSFPSIACGKGSGYMRLLLT